MSSNVINGEAAAVLNEPRLWLRAIRYVGLVLMLGMVSIMLLAEIPFPPPSEVTRTIVRLVFILDLILCLALPAYLEQIWMRKSHGVYLAGERLHRFSLRVAVIVLMPSIFIAMGVIMALAMTYDVAVVQVMMEIGNFFSRSNAEGLSTADSDLVIGLLLAAGCVAVYFAINYLFVRGWMVVTHKIVARCEAT